ncbi:unnamed protein product [Ixodes pacificus]
MQELLDVERHKMLHPFQTRWLSLHVVMERLLGQFSALLTFFENPAREDRLLAAEVVLHKLKDPTTKLYFQFLDYVLPFFIILNKELQVKETRIHKFHDRVSTILKTIVEAYIKPDSLHNVPLERLRYRDLSNFMPLEEIYLGGRVASAFSGPHGIDPTILHNFHLRCLEFYIEAASQILARFPLDKEQMTRLEAIDPPHSHGKDCSTRDLVPFSHHGRGYEQA